MKKTGITCLLFMLLFFNISFTSFASFDLNGDGYATQEEMNQWFQNNLGVSAEEWASNPEKYSGTNDTSVEAKEPPKAQNKEHTHSYTAIVTKEPTCTEAGEMTYKCSCGDSYTEVIAMKSHDYETNVTKEPTCTETGTETKVCKNCGDTIESIIPAIGHKPGEWVTDKEPTCAKEGKNVRYCSVCGEAVETIMVDKLPHTEGEWEVAQKPTLTKTGLKVVKCTECSEILKEEAIPANTTLLYALIGAGCLSLIGISAGIVRYKCKH